MATVKTHLDPRTLESLKAQTEDWLSHKTDLKSFKKAYLEALGPFPEQIFHRSIRKMGVSYYCAFDAEEDGAGVKEQPDSDADE